jgi:hypothetical protein
LCGEGIARSLVTMHAKQHDQRLEKPAPRPKHLSTAPDWTEREWFEIWLRMARRSYPLILK